MKRRSSKWLIGVCISLILAFLTFALFLVPIGSSAKEGNTKEFSGTFVRIDKLEEGEDAYLLKEFPYTYLLLDQELIFNRSELESIEAGDKINFRIENVYEEFLYEGGVDQGGYYYIYHVDVCEFYINGVEIINFKDACNKKLKNAMPATLILFGISLICFTVAIIFTVRNLRPIKTDINANTEITEEHISVDNGGVINEKTFKVTSYKESFATQFNQLNNAFGVLYKIIFILFGSIYLVITAIVIISAIIGSGLMGIAPVGVITMTVITLIMAIKYKNLFRKNVAPYLDIADEKAITITVEFDGESYLFENQFINATLNVKAEEIKKVICKKSVMIIYLKNKMYFYISNTESNRELFIKYIK